MNREYECRGMRSMETGPVGDGGSDRDAPGHAVAWHGGTHSPTHGPGNKLGSVFSITSGACPSSRGATRRAIELRAVAHKTTASAPDQRSGPGKN